MMKTMEACPRCIGEAEDEIFVADDSEAIRARLCALIGEMEGSVEVSVATGEAEAVREIRRAHPDLVILDLNLAQGSGLGVLRSLQGDSPETNNVDRGGCMGMEWKNGECQIWMTGEMTRCTVAETRDKLLAPLAGKGMAVVDLSQVSELDHAGVEVMLLAKIEAMARGRALRFVNHSRAVLETLESCDLTAFFCDPALLACRGTLN